MIYQKNKNISDRVKRLINHRSARNVFWNLLGGLSTGGLVVVATPVYVHKLGLEGYGILSLWLMMQIIMGLLDFGIGATIVKEFASSSDLNFKRNLLKTVEYIYWGVGIFLVITLYFSSGFFGKFWLKSSTIPISELTKILSLMAIALGFQFPNAIYSNAMIGLQEHGKMNIVQIIGNILRHGGGILILTWHNNLIWFFGFQLFVAMLQTLISRAMVWIMVSGNNVGKPKFDIVILKNLWRFSVGMAFTSFVAIMLANADRITLSKMVSTAELGKYGIALTATGLLQFGIQPFYRAFFPRYAELISLGDNENLRSEYFKSCQIMAVVIIPLGIIGWCFAPQLFHFWIGYNDQAIADIFRLLIIGITCSGLMWLPAAFQQAHGWTSLHVCMMAGAVIVGTPIAIFYSIPHYGTLGATIIWLLHGISDITLGLWLMHKRLLRGEFFKWYITIILPPTLITAFFVSIAWFTIPSFQHDWINLIWIAGTGILAVLSTLYFGSKWQSKF